MAKTLVVVFGASGFIGRCIVQKLVGRGFRVRAAVRRPEQALFLKSMGAVGDVSLFPADVCSELSVMAAMDGASRVVNAVGILTERGRQNFSNIHVLGVQQITRAAEAANVEHLVHMSAIGADVNSPSLYSRSKAEGENVTKGFTGRVTLLRPSLVFGPQDKFFNRFAAMSRVSPVLTIVNGQAKFEPVYVGDVAEAVVRVISSGSAGREIIELGGPRLYTFRELVELVLQQVGRERWVLSLSEGVALALAFFLEFMPNPLLTRDQVYLLRNDNITTRGSKQLIDLGIRATPLEAILSTYLRR